MARVEAIVQAEVPQTLDNLAHIAYSYLFHDLGEYFKAILRHFREMAAALKSQKHPFNVIFALLLELEQPCLGHTLSVLQDCQSTIFRQKLGHFNQMTVAAELTRLQSKTELQGIEATTHYLGLLKEAEHTVGATCPQTLEVRLGLAWHYLHIHHWEKAGHTAQVIIDLVIHSDLPTLQYKSIAYYLHAISYFERSRPERAELSLREAIRLAAQTWGWQDSRVLKYMSVFQHWLLEWRRIDEAQQLLQTIETHVASKQARIHECRAFEHLQNNI
ncbi:uncharacterized protein KY384_002308 [Bacidia gigantensis]|uniref:uncharacterized protein n=1 Tax=Bacidia gigantensis TaxID=2732470 RepID=UPI001D045DC1|nr:uncharacterized protein KY384_002308 [Bacidia gigantensis]KAG8533522.1 hypothetical protein KY384_002308 [Bacidia gigantensis]